LESGFAGGLRVALSPLLTDVPIILISVLLIDLLPPGALRWVGIAGGLVITWLAVEILRSARTATLPDTAAGKARPGRHLWRGALVNALNPHPYLFWATVGAPALVRGWQMSLWHVLAFLLPFYVLLIGSKLLVAWLVNRQAGSLSLTWYRRVLAACGLLLLFMAGWLMWQAWGVA
jgi:threonine/homoserine/homoserine lactone efflux protein